MTDGDLAVLYDRIGAAVGATGDAWRQEMMEATATIVRLWLDEGVKEWKQRARAAEAEVAELKAELARHHRDFERWEAMADRGAERLHQAETLIAAAAEMVEAAGPLRKALEALR